jgi:hypothetical protein
MNTSSSFSNLLKESQSDDEFVYKLIKSDSFKQIIKRNSMLSTALVNLLKETKEEEKKEVTASISTSASKKTYQVQVAIKQSETGKFVGISAFLKGKPQICFPYCVVEIDTQNLNKKFVRKQISYCVQKEMKKNFGIILKNSFTTEKVYKSEKKNILVFFVESNVAICDIKDNTKKNTGFEKMKDSFEPFVFQNKETKIFKVFEGSYLCNNKNVAKRTQIPIDWYLKEDSKKAVSEDFSDLSSIGSWADY